MIYLNQAATTWPKPEQVEKAAQAAIVLPPFSQNRSVASDNVNVMELCKKTLGKLFNIEDWNRIFFSSGATDSFNRIVRGLALCKKKVIVTANEHNAVLRPLYNIYKDIQIEIIGCSEDGELLYDELEEKLTPDVSAVFVNYCSNVTGMSVDLERIAKIVHKTEAVFIVDCSQSAGHIPVDVMKQEIDILVFTGHKGLFALQGTGGYYVRNGILLKPSVYGGTGYDSKRLVMAYDNEEYEVGTQNMHGIATLQAGADYVLKKGVNVICEYEKMLITTMRRKLHCLNKVIVYGKDDCSGSVVSFNIKGLNPADTAYILANNYNIIIRSGYHCAPLIHEALGCDNFGTVRVSVSCFNTIDEINQFLEAIEELEKSI